MFDPLIHEEKTKLHEWDIIPKPKMIDCELIKEWVPKKSKAAKGLSPITWTVSDIAKAGCLLSTPAIPTTFEDEHEMRRVYTLIYDVFRYKNVLTQALNDVNFFQVFPKLITIIPIVWLLFYDLYHRSFKKRETKVAQLASQLFDIYGLSFAENALWSQKVKLAASVARLRIKHNALSLSELLPPHLKDERVTEQAKNSPVTCWVNSLKISDATKLCKDIEEAFGVKMITDAKHISRNHFKWDRHCPQIIAFHASIRSKLARSIFVKEHLLIVQDKSFCLGPATFGKLIEDLELTGSVIQTHVNSPRTTAYLATLLSHNEKIKKLMAFSAGKRKTEYETYFNDLGMSNVVIFSDRLIDTPADANYMEDVVAVFATPPNSYSAVSDPIDLVCSRGGDLSMLEVLTESGDTKEARERVSNVLDEQRRTLRFAMSRPQIQFVLYETHSELEAENSFMVKKALREINRIAKVQHAALQGKVINNSAISESPEQSEINNNEKMGENVEEKDIELDQNAPVDTKSTEDVVDGEEKLLENVKVPDTDIFDAPDLPLLCPSENCRSFEKEGCYLALLQRKQIIRLDDKYMIQMAENRGLFGSNTTANTVKSKTSRTAKKKQEKQEKPQRTRKKLKDAEDNEEISDSSEKMSVKNCEEKENLFKRTSQLSEFSTKDSVSEAGTTNKATMIDQMMTRNILGRLSSAHIRQFVSPFYRQFDMMPLTLSKETQMSKISLSTAATQKIISVRRQINKKKMKKTSAEERPSNEKKTKIDGILARVCTPTQNYLSKIFKQQEAVTSKNPKKSAIEYSKRVYNCELCKRRNME